MEKLAPLGLALEWDNSGLQIGSYLQPVEKIMVTLTVTESIVDRAVAEQVDLIVAHHPLIFQPLMSIRTDLAPGRSLQKLLANNIAVYSSHTNLDRAQFGLNYWLAESLNLHDHKILEASEDGDVGLGRIGYIKPVKLQEFVEQLNTLWQIRVRYVGDPQQECKIVAICGGSGSSLITTAWQENADVFVTGDIKYHDALDAQALGIALVDAGHFATEKIMISRVARYLKSKLSSVAVVEAWDGDNPFMY